MHVFDTIWLYDPDDQQYEAQVREINSRAVGVKYNAKLDRNGRVETQISATIMRPVYNGGDRRVEIRNEVLQRDGWDWSYRPVPPIRKGAVVLIKNWDRKLEARVQGLVKGMGGAHPDYFAFEGIKAYKREGFGEGSDLGKIKGHRFTASTECIEKIIRNGKGRRLLLGPYMTAAEHRKFFKDLYS
jgi:hypothetical protein